MTLYSHPNAKGRGLSLLKAQGNFISNSNGAKLHVACTHYIKPADI